ncbi:hypothetical protein [Chryseolinea soli]|uniref:STAS/SEC14 domain-containing protein n=1 Tax=Chryseolinea soli TaxID=2321403 RepID=A0A385SNF5_9BACT|nr:hypothetical protein [Chryseolinea soli]AYB32036.1 hypothetical protein D4L85_16320 [Chryseolinea soli]
MQNYFENDFLFIRYDEKNHLLILEWKLAPASPEFKEGTNMLITAFEHFKTGKLVSDIRQLGAVHPDDQQWISNDWISRAVKAGFSCSAAVLPDDVFTHMSLEGMSSQSSDQLPAKTFDNMDDAIDWIKQF